MGQRGFGIHLLNEPQMNNFPFRFPAWRLAFANAPRTLNGQPAAPLLSIPSNPLSQLLPFSLLDLLASHGNN